MRPRFTAVPLLAIPLALALTGCGGSSSGGTPSTAATTPTGSSSTAAPAATAPANVTAAKAEVTTAWETFFNGDTKRAVAVSLLEDGANLTAALNVAAQEDKATGLKRKAKVKIINFVSPTTANVTWRLLNDTTPVLDNASGQAVLVDGHWLVSKLTFCTLVELGNNGKPVSGCS